jgi:hypothetical protein
MAGFENWCPATLRNFAGVCATKSCAIFGGRDFEEAPKGATDKPNRTQPVVFQLAIGRKRRRVPPRSKPLLLLFSAGNYS